MFFKICILIVFILHVCFQSWRTLIRDLILVFHIQMCSTWFSSFPKPSLSDVISAIGRPALDLAAGEVFGHRGAGYTHCQRRNLKEARVVFHAELMDPAYLGKYAVFPYDRTMSTRTVMSFQKLVDICQCLTATGPVLHVFSLGDRAKSVDQAISIHERSLLQGFPSWFIEQSSCTHRSEERAAVRAIGNAMSVPVVAAACFREISHLFHLRLDTTTALVMPIRLSVSDTAEANDSMTPRQVND
jgi:hypothetical protein